MITLLADAAAALYQCFAAGRCWAGVDRVAAAAARRHARYAARLPVLADDPAPWTCGAR